MCKLALMPFLSPDKSPLAWSLAHALSKPMCVNDRDGFGYAAMSPLGEIGTERWLTGDVAWQDTPEGIPSSLDALLKPRTAGPVIRDAAGADLREKPVMALLLHSRMATAARGLLNNHPHVSYLPSADVRTALIHNGVVRVNEKRLRYSTCDSETILTAYEKHYVQQNALNWRHAAAELLGYYALGIMHAGNGKDIAPHVDIIRDDNASLYVCWVRELDAPIVATASDHVKQACKKLGLREPICEQFRSNTFVRFDPATRTVISSHQFEGNKFWGYGDSWESTRSQVLDVWETKRKNKRKADLERTFANHHSTHATNTRGAYLSADMEAVQKALGHATAEMSKK